MERQYRVRVHQWNISGLKLKWSYKLKRICPITHSEMIKPTYMNSRTEKEVGGSLDSL